MLSDEEKEIFNNLKDYMQSNIDNGYHKFIYNDLGWDFKCIDCINAIDKVLKQSKEIEEYKKQLDLDYVDKHFVPVERYNQLEKEIEELKREKETNQQMIHLAETQVLGYGQGYKDGLNKETTATAIVARERENQIIYEGMKHKINMQWVLKIKAKIEEVDKDENASIPDFIEYAKEYATQKLQSLLKKE